MFKNIGKQRSLKIRVSADQGELAFANPLEYDWEALLARLHSTSYVPGPDEPLPPAPKP